VIQVFELIVRIIVDQVVGSLDLLHDLLEHFPSHLLVSFVLALRQE
jgi:hypothetical protein